MTSTSTTRRLRDAESGDAVRGAAPGLEPDWMSWLADAPTTAPAPVTPASVVGNRSGQQSSESPQWNEACATTVLRGDDDAFGLGL